MARLLPFSTENLWLDRIDEMKPATGLAEHRFVRANADRGHGSSASRCCTFMPVRGHLKTNYATGPSDDCTCPS